MSHASRSQLEHDYEKVAKISKVEIVTKAQNITSLEIQIDNFVMHLHEIKLNLLNKHQKIKLADGLALNQCEDKYSAALAAA